VTPLERRNVWYCNIQWLKMIDDIIDEIL